ncbi:MAG: hypothetical protein SNJ78_05180 [Spirochaetales bacterium]
MRPFILLLGLFQLSSFLPAQDYKNKYLELLQSQQMEELKKHLIAWEKAEPQNPEVYIAYFNYHVNAGMRTVQKMGKSQDGRYLMYSEREYDPDHAKAALTYIDKGLVLAPNRLDIHFGKARFLAELKEYKVQKDAILAILEHSLKNGNRWVWSNGIPVTSGEKSMFAGLEEYIGVWFDNFEATAPYIKEVTERQTVLYPNNPWGWNLLAGYYRYTENWEQALSCLLTAEKLDPGDGIVVANIGQCYKTLNQMQKAKEYFKKLETFADPRLKQFAKEQLAKLDTR